jgi:hypothetical protein
MMSVHCCDRMNYDLNQTCDQHPNRYDCPDAFIQVVGGRYTLIVHDGGTAGVEISFCPWGGRKLPRSEGQAVDV